MDRRMLEGQMEQRMIEGGYGTGAPSRREMQMQRMTMQSGGMLSGPHRAPPGAFDMSGLGGALDSPGRSSSMSRRQRDPFGGSGRLPGSSRSTMRGDFNGGMPPGFWPPPPGARPSKTLRPGPTFSRQDYRDLNSGRISMEELARRREVAERFIHNDGGEYDVEEPYDDDFEDRPLGRRRPTEGWDEFDPWTDLENRRHDSRGPRDMNELRAWNDLVGGPQERFPHRNEVGPQRGAAMAFEYTEVRVARGGFMGAPGM